MRARHRLSKLLLRHGIVYYGGHAWTGRHDTWLRHEAAPRLTSRATRVALDCDYATVLAVQARRDRLDVAIGEIAAASEVTPLVHRLGCLQDQHPDRIRAGRRDRRLAPLHRQHHRLLRRLVPSEYSSGPSRKQGAITKTGNTRVGRLLVEAAWHHRSRYRVGKTIRDRWDLAPAAARIRGDEGNRRLHQRWVRFLEHRKRPTNANVAIARELAGCCWSLAILEEQRPTICFVISGAGGSAWSDPRHTLSSPRGWAATTWWVRR